MPRSARNCSNHAGRCSSAGQADFGGRARCLPLPAFLDGADDHGTPRLAFVGAGSQTRSYCTLCVARLPGTPPIKVYHGHAPVICPRHHRWLGIPTAPGQFDLSNTPEIITANRRRDRLLRSQHDQRWTDTQFRTAEWVTTGWSGMVHLRWHRNWPSAGNSAAPLSPPPRAAHLRQRLVLLPETAVLAEIFCDPQWRRQIAAASYYGHRSVLPARRAPPWPAFRVGHRRPGLRRPARVLGRSTPGPSPQHLPRRLAPSNPSRANTR